MMGRTTQMASTDPTPGSTNAFPPTSCPPISFNFNESTVPTPQNTQKVLEDLSTQMLLMQRTMKTMADEITELRKVSLDIKEGQNQIINAIGQLTTGHVPRPAPVTFQLPTTIVPQVQPAQPVFPTSQVVPTQPSQPPAQFNFGKVFPGSVFPPNRVPPLSFNFNEVRKDLPPTVAGYLLNQSFTQLGLEQTLQKIKELPNWRKDVLEKDCIPALHHATKNFTDQHQRDLLVNFFKEQSEGLDLSRDHFWTFRLEFIYRGLEANPDSILFDAYKQPLTEFVEYWKMEMQHNFEAVKIAVKCLIRVLQYSSNEGAHIEAVQLLNSVSQRLSLQQREELGITTELIPALVKLMRPEAHPKYLNNAWIVLWNITDESPQNCIKFVSVGGLQNFYSNYQRYKDDCNFLLNMFGVLGNVVEVEGLKYSLREEKILQIFRSIIEESTQPMQIVVIVSGVLAHLLSGGKKGMECNFMAPLLLQEIPKWTSSVHLSVNYNNLKPISHLLTHQEQACQLYGAWFIANLLSTNKPTYLPLVEKENIKGILQNISADPNTIEPTKTLVGNILSQL